MPGHWLGQFVILFGLCFMGSGCALESESWDQLGRSNQNGSIVANRSLQKLTNVAPQPRADKWVNPADKFRHTRSGKVVQAGGVSQKWNSVTTAFRDGVEKMGDAMTPRTSVRQAPDPTALNSIASPSASLYLSTARMAEKSGQFAEAEQYYRNALSLEPANPAALFAFGRLRDRQGKLPEATQFFQQAATADPNNATIANHLGLSYAKRGMISPAIEAVRRAVQLRPADHRYRNNLAMLLVDADNPDGAFSHLRAIQDEATAYYNLGYLMNKRGETSTATNLFAKALQKNPNMTSARVWLEHLGGSPLQPAGSMLTAPPELTRPPVHIGPTQVTGRPILPPVTPRAVPVTPLPPVADDRTVIPLPQVRPTPSHGLGF